MKIAHRLGEIFADFELDINAVELSSINKNQIWLPYSGPLPDGLMALDVAYISFNIQLLQDPRVLLVIRGKPEYCSLLAMSKDEIMEILDKFFDLDSPGLSRYWAGFWIAHYSEWQKVAWNCRKLLSPWRRLSNEERELLTQRWADEQEYEAKRSKVNYPQTLQ